MSEIENEIENRENKINLLLKEIENMKTATHLYTLQKEDEISNLKNSYDYEINLLRKIVKEYSDDVTITNYEKDILLCENKELTKKVEGDKISDLPSLNISTSREKQNIFENAILKPLRKVTSLNLVGSNLVGNVSPSLGSVLSNRIISREQSPILSALKSSFQNTLPARTSSPSPLLKKRSDNTPFRSNDKTSGTNLSEIDISSKTPTEPSNQNIPVVKSSIFSPERPLNSNVDEELSNKYISFHCDDIIEAELEQSMQQAKEEADKLKAIVLPLEYEIERLKQELIHRDNFIFKNKSYLNQAKQINDSSFRKAPCNSSQYVYHSTKWRSLPHLLDGGQQPLKYRPDYILNSNQKRDGLSRLYSSELCLSTGLLKTMFRNMYIDNAPCSNEKSYNFVKRRPSLKVLWQKTDKNEVQETNLAKPSQHQNHKHISGKLIDQTYSTNNTTCSPASNFETVKLRREIDRLSEELNRERILREELEERFDDYATNMREKMSVLVQEIKESESKRDHLKKECQDLKINIESEIEELVDRIERLKVRVGKVMNQNGVLLGKHSTKSREMQDKLIDLPNSIEDLQIYVLKLTEDYISALIAKEYCEEQCAFRIKSLNAKLAQEKLSSKPSHPNKEKVLQGDNNISQLIPSTNEINSAIESRNFHSDAPGTFIDIESVLNISPAERQDLLDTTNSQFNLLNKHHHLPSPIKPIPIKPRDLLETDQLSNIGISTLPTYCPECGILISGQEDVTNGFEELEEENEDGKSKIAVTSTCQKCGKAYCFNCISRRTLVSKDISVKSLGHSSNLTNQNETNASKIPPASVIKVCEHCYKAEMHKSL